LPLMRAGESDPNRLRQAAILEAECYQALGESTKAKQVIHEIITSDAHSDLYFAAANLEESMEKKLQWMNKSMQKYGLMPIALDPSFKGSYYDSITTRTTTEASKSPTEILPKVTVVMPVYNAEEVIRTAIESVLSQTWTNIEVIVVDDCSTDSTPDIIEEYIRRDSRIKFIRTEKNGGAYVARNYALRIATGEFVTCNDSDDWS